MSVITCRSSTVLDLIKPDIESITIKNKAATPEQKFLTVLRFYASGSFLVNLGHHQRTTSKIVKQAPESVAFNVLIFIIRKYNL